MNDEEEEIFLRPIQKQEIIKLLRKYHLLNEKDVRPLDCLTDTDFIDIDLAAFYWNLLKNKNGADSSRLSESSISKLRDSFSNIIDFDSDILESSRALEKIQWSELMEPENDDKFEEFENTLMQLDDSLPWEKASLKILEEYAKNVMEDKEILESLSNEEYEETKENELNYILVQNQENKMNKVLDLDKRIKELMEELGDERKKKQSCTDRNSLHTNSVLNDTLEEMEVFMKCGESYMTRESIVRQSSSFTRSKSDDSIYEKSETTTPIPKPERYCKTPQLKRNPKRKPKQKVNSSPSTSSTSDFKIPSSRPLRRPAVNSPIGEYIRNSPTTPLIKKVVSTPISGPIKLTPYREVLQENVNKIPTKLPTKTYKPAERNIYVEKENDSKIPKNIQKLYTAPIPEIIKHVGRVKSDDAPVSLDQLKSNFENSEDLTVLEDANLDETRRSEVSLYVSKHPSHTNSLQNNCN